MVVSASGLGSRRLGHSCTCAGRAGAGATFCCSHFGWALSANAKRIQPRVPFVLCGYATLCKARYGTRGLCKLRRAPAAHSFVSFKPGRDLSSSVMSFLTFVYVCPTV